MICLLTYNMYCSKFRLQHLEIKSIFVGNSCTCIVFKLELVTIMCNDQIADSPFLDNSITVHSPECFSFLELRITRNIPLYAGSTYLYSLIIVSGSAQNCSCHEDTGS